MWYYFFKFTGIEGSNQEAKYLRDQKATFCFLQETYSNSSSKCEEILLRVKISEDEITNSFFSHFQKIEKLCKRGRHTTVYRTGSQFNIPVVDMDKRNCGGNLIILY